MADDNYDLQDDVQEANVRLIKMPEVNMESDEDSSDGAAKQKQERHLSGSGVQNPLRVGIVGQEHSHLELKNMKQNYLSKSASRKSQLSLAKYASEEREVEPGLSFDDQERNEDFSNIRETRQSEARRSKKSLSPDQK